jgi:hypothetical protein
MSSHQRKNRYFGGISSISDAVSSLLDADLKRRGFNDKRILTNWRDIVDEIADLCHPVKMTYRKEASGVSITLYVSTNDRSFYSEFIYHRSNIMNRVNFYFGKDYISDVKVLIV